MLATLLAVMIGMLFGWMLGGTVGWLPTAKLNSWPLLAVGVVTHVVPELIDLPASMVWTIASGCLLILFCLRNLRLIGLGVVAVGIGLNLFVSVLNWGMPVDAEALLIAEVTTVEDLRAGVELRGDRHLATNGDYFTSLGDKIPVVPFAMVASFGDLIVLVGLADLMANLMIARRQRLIVEATPKRPRASGRRRRPDDTDPDPDPNPDGDPEDRERELVAVG